MKASTLVIWSSHRIFHPHGCQRTWNLLTEKQGHEPVTKRYGCSEMHTGFQITNSADFINLNKQTTSYYETSHQLDDTTSNKKYDTTI